MTYDCRYDDVWCRKWWHMKKKIWWRLMPEVATYDCRKWRHGDLWSRKWQNMTADMVTFNAGSDDIHLHGSRYDCGRGLAQTVSVIYTHTIINDVSNKYSNISITFDLGQLVINMFVTQFKAESESWMKEWKDISHLSSITTTLTWSCTIWEVESQNDQSDQICDACMTCTFSIPNIKRIYHNRSIKNSGSCNHI